MYNILATHNKDSIRLINIDCDLYSSTNTVLNLLAKKIVPGSIIIFDEYLVNENWREDEFKSFQKAVKKYELEEHGRISESMRNWEVYRKLQQSYSTFMEYGISQLFYPANYVKINQNQDLLL